jgi:hypothetical protein
MYVLGNAPSPEKDFKDQVSTCSSCRASSRNHYKTLIKDDKRDFADSQPSTSKKYTANSKYGIIQHIATIYTGSFKRFIIISLNLGNAVSDYGDYKEIFASRIR